MSPLPDDIRKLGAGGVNRIWRDAKLRGAEVRKAKSLVSAAEYSVGSKDTTMIEQRELLDDMDVHTTRLEELLRNIE